MPPSRSVEGVVEMMLDATQSYAEPLTAERLFGWHAALFPTGFGASRRVTVGAWRRPTTVRNAFTVCPGRSSGSAKNIMIYWNAPKGADWISRLG